MIMVYCLFVFVFLVINRAKNRKQTHEREPFPLLAQSEPSRVYGYCVVATERGLLDHIIPESIALRKALFSFYTRGLWNLQSLRTVSVSHLISGEAKIQAQISLMIHFSGACGLADTGGHLGSSGF